MPGVIKVGTAARNSGPGTALYGGRPPTGPVLPDVTVFGPYTYLVTELVWGALALFLLVHADAVRSAARTVVVLYPVAYVWDWYTLEAGVFAIRMRTGVDLLGIPLEEHLFMVVVPALVVGIHETLRTYGVGRADVEQSD